MQRARVLATDMDGTFIPLDGNAENRRDLELLCDEMQQHGIDLVYVTGRHYELVLDAISAHALPTPDWLICDVGTSIYRHTPGDEHRLVPAYHEHLAKIVSGFDVEQLEQLFAGLDDLRKQEDEKQGRFKLSYNCDAVGLSGLTSRLTRMLVDSVAPYRIIASVDPFTNAGLIDFLPRGVSKDYALRWWVHHTHCDEEEVIFAGDSGNDLAALTAGYRSIVVGNADASIAEQVRCVHESAGWTGRRLFLAKKPATSGVREGLRHYLHLA